MILLDSTYVSKDFSTRKKTKLTENPQEIWQFYVISSIQHKINQKITNMLSSKVLTSVEDKHGKEKYHLSRFYQYSIVHIAEITFPYFLSRIKMQTHIN